MDEAERKRIRAVSEALLARRYEPEPEPAPPPAPEPMTMADVISLSDHLRREQRDAERDWYVQQDADREAESRRRRAIERRAAEPPPEPDWSRLDERLQQAVEAERRFVLDVVAEAMRGRFETELRPIEDKLLTLETLLNCLREPNANERVIPLSSRARAN